MNYEKDLYIDDSSLDIECLNQPSLFMRYAKHYAETQRDLDEAKQALDITRAEVDKAIRENPADYGIEKVTEGSVGSAILTDKKYQKANQEYLDAKFEKDMAGNAVQALNTKKDMLEALIKLNGQEYFAGPRVPRNLTEERKLREKKTDSAIASKLSRGK